MTQQITKGVKVSVETFFEGSFIKNQQIYFAFGYKIAIENQSEDIIRLETRHWDIYDSLNYPEVVDGEGVIGKKPILHPGQEHNYTSGCLLSSPIGSMKGFYTMVNLKTSTFFHVAIPAFQLAATHTIN